MSLSAERWFCSPQEALQERPGCTANVPVGFVPERSTPLLERRRARNHA
jgi:hypothetical protein